MFTHEVRQLLELEREHLERLRVALARDHLADDDQRGATGELSGADQHLADVGTETFDREVELGLLHTIEDELDEVNRAIGRLASRQFGRCQVCGAAIPEERLRAVPATRLCFDHQQAEEVDVERRAGSGRASAEHDAIANLDLLPSDEPEPGPSPAEEAAIHTIDVGT